MSLTNSSEFNAVGGGPGFGSGGGFGYGGGFGGLGAIGLFGLIGLDGLRGRGHDSDCCEDIKENARNLAVLQAIAGAKDQTVFEGRGLGAAICDAEKTNMQQFYAQAIQSERNTQQLSAQAQAIAAIADARFDAVERAGVAQTAAILAKINQTEIDGLRDQLFLERERCRTWEGKADITQLGIAFGNQIQAANSNVVAVQSQVSQLVGAIGHLADKVNKASNDVINFGTMAASGNQANQQTNVK